MERWTESQSRWRCFYSPPSGMVCSNLTYMETIKEWCWSRIVNKRAWGWPNRVCGTVLVSMLIEHRQSPQWALSQSSFIQKSKYQFIPKLVLWVCFESTEQWIERTERLYLENEFYLWVTNTWLAEWKYVHMQRSDSQWSTIIAFICSQIIKHNASCSVNQHAR